MEDDARLGALDEAIIRQLNINARQSFRDMAKALGVSISTVSAHVKRLEEEGVLKGYAPIVDEAKVGYDLLAVIGLKIARGQLLPVQEEIGKDPRVYGVYDVTGEWDSIVTARFRSTRELDGFVKGVLSQEHVERTYTQVVLNVVKDEKRVIL